MTEHFDIAIAGATPLSGLLAGALAREHGLNVCWIGRLLNPLQPQRGFDISVGPVTRPETWRLLASTVPETLRFLSSFGDGRIHERVDPLIHARSEEAAHALLHMRSVAQGLGVELEPQAIASTYRAAFRIRDAVRIQRRPLIAALPEWLKAQGVTHFTPEEVKLKVGSGGTVQIVLQEGKVAADRLVLAGDAAIAAHLPEAELRRYFHRFAMSALLLEPVTRLPASVIINADTGGITYQRSNGALDCAGRGGATELAQDALLHAPGGERSRLAGTARFHGLCGTDGAPVVGSTSHSGTFVIGGLGVTGLFQLPALARLLAGSASPAEAAYFNARAPGNTGSRPGVAEYTSVVDEGLTEDA